jgi:hypothetical protein
MSNAAAAGSRNDDRASALPWSFWLALAAVLIGWFPCDTLTTTVGALQLHFHFFDLASVITRPARIVTGLNRGDALTIPFGLLCLAASAAPLASGFSDRRIARLGPCAPLALMLVTGVLLYAVTSGDTFTTAPDAGRVTTALTHFGNLLVNRASNVVASRISVGLGVWLSVPGALYLALGALRGRWLVRAPLARDRGLARKDSAGLA